MKRCFKTLVAITTLTVTTASSINTQACDRGGRRISLFRGGIGLSISPPSRHRSQPIYTSHPQPVFAPPGQPHPFHDAPIDPGFPGHVIQSQPVYQQGVPSMGGHPQSLPSHPFPQSIGHSQTQPLDARLPNGMATNPHGQSGLATVAHTGARPVNGAMHQGSLPVNPGSVAVGPQGVASSQGMQQGMSQGRVVPQGNMSAQRSVAGQSLTAAPQSIANKPAVVTPSSPAAADVSAEASALQLLASIDAGSESLESSTGGASTLPEVTEGTESNDQPIEASSDALYFGTWSVTLPGNQSVVLILNDNGSFSWTATKDGKSSNFDGQYRMESGRLILVRSNDLQQMAGSWSGGGDQFTFKLDGATTGGLDFKRG